MKIIFWSILIAFTFASCGEDTDALQKDICDCYQEAKEYAESSLATTGSAPDIGKMLDECQQMFLTYFHKHTASSERQIIADCL